MITKEINGKTIGFCFNFYAFGIVEEQLDKPLDEVLSILANPKKPKVKIISAFFYAGAVNYCEMNDILVDFKINDVGGWLEEIGIAESMKILTDALSVVKPKNLPPLQAEGVKIGE